MQAPASPPGGSSTGTSQATPAAAPASGTGSGGGAPPIPPRPRPEGGATPSRPTPPPARQPERHDRLALPIAVVSGIVALAALGLALADRGRVEVSRIEALEQRQQALQPLPGQLQALQGPVSQSAERLAALEGTLRDGTATQNQQIQSLAAQVAAQANDREAVQRAADTRIAEAERSLAQRISAAEAQLAQRIAAAEAAFGPRFVEVESAMRQRIAESEAAARDRLAARDRELDARFENLQQRETRLTSAERRLSLLIATTATEGALQAGRELGRALSSLPGEPPAALRRYAALRPPTDASLRLSFEDAARAALAQTQPSAPGQGVWESAAQRLGNLVTVRRGDEVVWGDAVSGEVESARRALEAGDLRGAVRRVEALPQPTRGPMEEWLDQAKGLVAAREAIEALRNGDQG
ncbi:COG4223 family protein [Pseudoroseomonas globiformis]|uniref:COG4223 family protein n=1 Tax=Teichococcus globiformis TaxID=2307229 RepID=A0ABV7G4V7_9PROT